MTHLWIISVCLLEGPRGHRDLKGIQEREERTDYRELLGYPVSAYVRNVIITCQLLPHLFKKIEFWNLLRRACAVKVKERRVIKKKRKKLNKVELYKVVFLKCFKKD